MPSHFFDNENINIFFLQKKPLVSYFLLLLAYLTWGFETQTNITVTAEHLLLGDAGFHLTV